MNGRSRAQKMFLYQAIPVLLSVILFKNADAVYLYLTNSDADPTPICIGQKVNYFCVVPEAAESIAWTATPVLGNISIQFSYTTPPDQRLLGCSNVSSVPCADFDFQATLLVGAVGMNSTSAEFLASDFTYSVTAELDGTVVECIGVTENVTTKESLRFSLVLPLPPERSTYAVRQYGQNNVTITVLWHSGYDFWNSESVKYAVTVSPGFSLYTTIETRVLVTLSYNVMHTVSIAATNCNGNSKAIMETIRIANCSSPNPLGNGSIEAFQYTTEGAEIYFRCNPGFTPAGRMRAVCTSDGRWNPDPATHVCMFIRVVCGDPTPASGVNVGPYNSTNVNSSIFYLCNQSGYTPSSPGAVCGEDGRWSPDPSQVECRIITTPTGEITGGLSGGEVAGIVIVLLLITVLVVGVVIAGLVWKKKRSYIPSNLQLQSQGADAKPGDAFGVKSKEDILGGPPSMHSRQEEDEDLMYKSI